MRHGPGPSRCSIGRLVCLAACATTLGACAPQNRWEQLLGAATPSRDGQALVLTTPEVEAAGLPPAFDRFEFGRKDAEVNVIARGPMNAANAWPLPPRPGERRVRFSDWQQR